MIAPEVSGDIAITDGGDATVNRVTGNITMGQGKATLNVVVGDVEMSDGSELISDDLTGDFTIDNGGEATVERLVGRMIMRRGRANVKRIQDFAVTVGEGAAFKSENVEGDVEVDGETAEITLDNVTGNVNIIKGINKPGDSPGGTTINGNYAQGAGAQLDMEIAGTDSSLYDQLVVIDGTINLAGTTTLHS